MIFLVLKVHFRDYLISHSLFCSIAFSVQALDWPTNDLNAVEYYLYVGDQEPFIFKIDVDPVELLNSAEASQCNSHSKWSKYTFCPNIP